MSDIETRLAKLEKMVARLTVAVLSCDTCPDREGCYSRPFVETSEDGRCVMREDELNHD